MLLPTVISDHLAAMKPGEIISVVQQPSRIDLAIAVIQQGRYPEMLGSDRSLYPFEMLETAKDFFPPLFIFHGTDDTAVEVERTQRFVQKFREVVPKGKVLVKYEPGEHVFDSPVGLEVPWLKQGLAFVAEEWLG